MPDSLFNKRGSCSGVFLWILQNFWEQLFYITPLDDCFWCVSSHLYHESQRITFHDFSRFLIYLVFYWLCQMMLLMLLLILLLIVGVTVNIVQYDNATYIYSPLMNFCLLFVVVIDIADEIKIRINQTKNDNETTLMIKLRIIKIVSKICIRSKYCQLVGFRWQQVHLLKHSCILYIWSRVYISFKYFPMIFSFLQCQCYNS